MQIGTVADADLAFDDRDAVERLALPLVGQLEMAKAFVRQIEGTVNSPQLVASFVCRSRLGDRGRIDEPDQATAARFRRR